MPAAISAARFQFAFTILFHYLFPVLSMGLGILIAALKTLETSTHRGIYGDAARFWARIFAITFAAGVVTGIPMEFQFGTNWAEFSRFAGGVVGQTLFLEGLFAFFAESTFLGIFLFGEHRVSPRLHWLSAVMVALGAVLSGFFVVATDAWMQHPVGYRLVNGRAELTSLVQLLTNPYLGWQFAHVLSGSMVTASMVMAGVGAWFLLARRHEGLGQASLRVGVVSAVFFTITSLVPTGAGNGENVTEFQPAKMAAMEGLFQTQEGAPMAIIGMPDTQTRTLTDPIYVPRVLSYLAYGDSRARVPGLDAFPLEDQPPVELVYYAYHIMVGLGTIFIVVALCAGALLWRGRLFTSTSMLWTLMLVMPFPYIANQAGWIVAEVGRQPWLIYGVQRTAAGVSTNVTAGMTWFSLIGFMGLYLLIGLLYLLLFVRIVWRGLGDQGAGGAESGAAEAH